MKVQNKEYYYISAEKERVDAEKLIYILSHDKWVDRETILVNCAPDYSSILTQNINHRLSHLNRNDLFEVIPFQMPYPIMNQVWNSETLQYEKNDYYVKTWLNKYINKDYKYLFISSGKHTLDKLKLCLQDVDYRLCSPYVAEGALIPTYYVEIFKTGQLLYSWENVNNTNWNG